MSSRNFEYVFLWIFEKKCSIYVLDKYLVQIIMDDFEIPYSKNL